jgi:hypothetical protein
MVFLENLNLRPTAAGSITEKVGGMGVFGMLFLIGPKSHYIQKRVETVLAQRQSYEQVKASRYFDDEHTQKRCRFYDSKAENRPPRQSKRRDPLVAVSRLRLPFSTLRDQTVSSNVAPSHEDDTMTIVRFCGENVEDVYCLLYNTLKPLENELGYVPFSDRILPQVVDEYAVTSMFTSYDNNRI